MRISAKTIAFTALLAAVICAVSPWTIPLGPIPLSLASLGVYLAACVLDCKHGVAAVVAYVVIGGVGLPVFSGARGGFGALVGPTGGYIIGYILLALAEGLIIDLFAKEKRIWLTLSERVGTWRRRALSFCPRLPCASCPFSRATRSRSSPQRPWAFPSAVRSERRCLSGAKKRRARRKTERKNAERE